MANKSTTPDAPVLVAVTCEQAALLQVIFSSELPFHDTVVPAGRLSTENVSGLVQTASGPVMEKLSHKATQAVPVDPFNSCAIKSPFLGEI